MALLANHNVIGYILLVALAAIIVLRVQGSRRRVAPPRPMQRRLAGGADRPDKAADADEDEASPGRFARARLQFLVTLIAAIAIVVAYILRH